MLDIGVKLQLQPDNALVMLINHNPIRFHLAYGAFA